MQHEIGNSLGSDNTILVTMHKNTVRGTYAANLAKQGLFISRVNKLDMAPMLLVTL